MNTFISDVFLKESICKKKKYFLFPTQAGEELQVSTSQEPWPAWPGSCANSLGGAGQQHRPGQHRM